MSMPQKPSFYALYDGYVLLFLHTHRWWESLGISCDMLYEDEIERAIDEVLAGRPRSHDLAEMIAALQIRRDSFLRERDAAPSDEHRKEWDRRLREVEQQIAILRQEQAITEFVEDSVRVTVTRANLEDQANDRGQ